MSFGSSSFSNKINHVWVVFGGQLRGPQAPTFSIDFWGTREASNPTPTTPKNNTCVWIRIRQAVLIQFVLFIVFLTSSGSTSLLSVWGFLRTVRQITNRWRSKNHESWIKKNEVPWRHCLVETSDALVATHPFGISLWVCWRRNLRANCGASGNSRACANSVSNNLRKHVKNWSSKLFKNSLTTYDVFEPSEINAKTQLDLQGKKQIDYINNHRIGIGQTMRGSHFFLAESAASASVLMTSIIIHDCHKS